MAQETFSDRLRQAMSDRDVRQSDVIRASEMLGKKLGKSQMSQYVSGKTIPRRDVAELLARIWRSMLPGCSPVTPTKRGIISPQRFQARIPSLSSNCKEHHHAYFF